MRWEAERGGCGDKGGGKGMGEEEGGWEGSGREGEELEEREQRGDGKGGLAEMEEGERV